MNWLYGPNAVHHIDGAVIDTPILLECACGCGKTFPKTRHNRKYFSAACSYKAWVAKDHPLIEKACLCGCGRTIKSRYVRQKYFEEACRYKMRLAHART